MRQGAPETIVGAAKTWDTWISSSELRFSNNNMTVTRPGNAGTFPAALVKSLGLAFRITALPNTHNSLIIGVREDDGRFDDGLPNFDGGFGKQKSCGLWTTFPGEQPTKIKHSGAVLGTVPRLKAGDEINVVCTNTLDKKYLAKIFVNSCEVGLFSLPDHAQGYVIGATLPNDAVLDMLPFTMSTDQETTTTTLACHALWDNRLYTDLTVIGGGRKFQVHRAMLAAASDVFQKTLEAPMRENCEKCIEIDASPDAIEALLKHIYTGDRPQDGIAGDVLLLAHRFDLKNLVHDCCAALLSQLSASTIAAVVCALRPFREIAPMQQTWEEMLRRVDYEPELVRPLMDALA